MDQVCRVWPCWVLLNIFFLVLSFLTDSSIWIQCLEPAHIVEWNIILFFILITLSGLQVIICFIRIVIQLSKILCGTYSVIIQVTAPHWHLNLTHFTLTDQDSMSFLKSLLEFHYFNSYCPHLSLFNC